MYKWSQKIWLHLFFSLFSWGCILEKSVQFPRAPKVQNEVSYYPSQYQPDGATYLITTTNFPKKIRIFKNNFLASFAIFPKCWTFFLINFRRMIRNLIYNFCEWEYDSFRPAYPHDTRVATVLKPVNATVIFKVFFLFIFQKQCTGHLFFSLIILYSLEFPHSSSFWNGTASNFHILLIKKKVDRK